MAQGEDDARREKHAVQHREVEEMRNRTLLVMSALLMVFGSLLGIGAAKASVVEAPEVMEFDTMFPVIGPWVGTANPIRGVSGGGLPWTIAEGEGELRSDGRLEIEVEGLVLADDPAVPAALRLTNPVAEFRALVSCISHDMEGNVITANVSTDPFPATPEGDAEIDASVMLPQPCLAPIIFVTSATGRWFAVTGTAGGM